MQAVEYHNRTNIVLEPDHQKNRKEGLGIGWDGTTVHLESRMLPINVTWLHS